MMRSTRSFSSRARARLPSGASITSCPWRTRARCTMSRVPASSSMTRMRAMSPSREVAQDVLVERMSAGKTDGGEASVQLAESLLFGRQYLLGEIAVAVAGHKHDVHLAEPASVERRIEVGRHRRTPEHE